MDPTEPVDVGRALDELLKGVLPPNGNFVLDEEPHMIRHPDAWGYMPVSLGDVLDGGAYEVVRKLGWGVSGSVWLARRRTAAPGSTRYVALKILNATATRNEDSDITYEYITHECMHSARYLRRKPHPGFRHCLTVSLAKTFTAHSVHGRHHCLVAPLCGPPLHNMLQAQPGGGRFPLAATRRIVGQILLALKFLHTKADIVHCDLKPANVLVKLGSDHDAIAQFLAEHPSETYPARSCPLGLSGSDEPITSVTVKSQPLPILGHDPAFLDNIEICVGDFSNATPRNMLGLPGMVICTTAPYCAPEQLLGCVCSPAIDIWAVGCIVYECLVGRMLFQPHIDKDAPQTRYAEAHLVLMHSRFGSFPRELLSRGTKRDRYFDAEGNLLRCPAPGADVFSLEQSVRDALPPEIGDDDVNATCAFMRRCLTTDPECRPTASQLLKDAWLAA